MYVKTKGIILKNTNYSESSLITKIYTQTSGLKTFMLRGVRKGKASIRTSMIQPLSIVSLDFFQKPNTTIFNVKELKNTPVLYEIHSNIFKKTIAMFYTEVLNQCLTEEESDEALFGFLENEIIALDHSNFSADLPIRFLIKLSNYLGVYPQGSHNETTPFFCIESGGFVSQSSLYTSSIETSFLISNFILDINNNQQFNRSVRKDALDQIIKYYQFHVTRNKKIKSVDILREILN